MTKKYITRSHDTSPLHLFRQGIRSEVTRRTYTYTLRRILCDILEDVLEGDFERRAGQFVQRARDDPDWTLDLLLSLAWKLREQTELPKDHAEYLNPTSVPSHFMPVRKLLDMNSASMPWRSIYATFPEKDNILDTRGWTRQEIAAMLVHARDPMDRTIVLLLASSGVRAGALNQLNWGDITPVYREGGRLTVDPSGGGEVACVTLSIYSGSRRATRHSPRRRRTAPACSTAAHGPTWWDASSGPEIRYSCPPRRCRAGHRARPWPSGCARWPTRWAECVLLK